MGGSRKIHLKKNQTNTHTHTESPNSRTRGPAAPTVLVLDIFIITSVYTIKLIDKFNILATHSVIVIISKFVVSTAIILHVDTQELYIFIM